MDRYNYSEVKELLQSYTEKFSSSFTTQQKDLVSEFINKLGDLEQISSDIVNVNSHLFDASSFNLNNEDEIEIMGFKLKLKRADPNVPIQLDNATKAYSRGNVLSSVNPETIDKERRLERLASEFYRVAHRIAHIAEKLPVLTIFTAKSIRMIRNHLIEHPESTDSGITNDSFSYSKNEGPLVKGLRVGDKAQFMDKGFKINNEEFLSELKIVLLKSLAQLGSNIIPGSQQF